MTETNKTIQNEIEYYNSLPCVFEDFMDMPALCDGTIRLVCAKKHLIDFYGSQLPAYVFDIYAGEIKVGDIRLRIGYTEGIYYSGHIGFAIDEAHRGKGYALRACRLLAPVANFHAMPKLLITNDENNIASYRVCEKLGAKFLRKAELPSWHDAYKEGHSSKNIFEWDLGVLDNNGK